MKNIGTLFALALSLLMAWPASAEPDAGSAASADPLAAYGTGLAALQEIAGNGIITSAQSAQAADHLLKQASAAVGRPVTAEEALASRSGLGSAGAAPQAKKSRITVLGVLWVISIIVGIASLGVVFWWLWVLLAAALIMIPKIVYEFLLFALSAAAFAAPFVMHLGPEVAPFVGLTACLAFGGGLAFTFKVHDIKFSGSRFSLPLFAVWAAAAIAFQSSLIGFFAMAALLSALGFSAFMVPGCIAVGFEDDDSVPRATAAAFAVLAAFVIAHAFRTVLPVVEVFKVGALYLCTFVGYLGLLIASSVWYAKKGASYFVMQVVTVVLGLAALMFGTHLGLPELQKIGGTFFALYAAEKTFEIPKKSLIGWGFAGLVFSGALYAFCWYVAAHPDIFRQYTFLV